MNRPLVFCLFCCLLLPTACAPIGDIEPPNARGPNSDAPPDMVKPVVAKQGLLKKRLEDVLKHVEKRELKGTHSFWTVIHGVLAHGLKTPIVDEVTGQRINALDYMCKGGRPRGLKFLLTSTGVDVQLGPQYDGQGHQDQFIGELAQQGISKKKEFHIDGGKYHFDDFLNHAKMRASTTKEQELSWTLVALAQYYGTDFSWTNTYGEKLHFNDLVQYELDLPVDNSNKSACGGTHRLFGLTWAYYVHMRDGGKKTELWKNVAKKLEAYKARARKFRNTDGSFSTKYFTEAESDPDITKRLSSTGHIVEWLALCCTEDELRTPWVQDGVHALIRLILENERFDLDAGALYHGTHGLRVYYNRMYGGNKHGVKLPPPPGQS